MLRYYVIPLLLASSYVKADILSLHSVRRSAASPAQIRYATQNKYDDTGPGAKEPEYAYNTFKNIDEALVAYLDDPSTKLPEHEKAKAIANLYRNNYNFGNNAPKRVDAFTGNKPNVVPILVRSYSKFDVSPKLSVFNSKINPNDLRKELFSWQKEQAVKTGPSVHDPFIKDFHYAYKPSPEVEFMDTHNKETGDLKSAKELKDGSGAVHGYYTMVEDDGRKSTYYYENNPLQGFRSHMHRIYN